MTTHASREPVYIDMNNETDAWSQSVVWSPLFCITNTSLCVNEKLWKMQHADCFTCRVCFCWPSCECNKDLRLWTLQHLGKKTNLGDMIPESYCIPSPIYFELIYRKLQYTNLEIKLTHKATKTSKTTFISCILTDIWLTTLVSGENMHKHLVNDITKPRMENVAYLNKDKIW